MADADAAKALVKLQGEASTAGAFAIAEGQRKASEETANLRAEGRAKLEAELETIFTNVQEETRAFVGGSAVSGASDSEPGQNSFSPGPTGCKCYLIRSNSGQPMRPIRKTKSIWNSRFRILNSCSVRRWLSGSLQAGNQILEQMLQKMNDNRGGGPLVPSPVKAPPVPRRPIAAQP